MILRNIIFLFSGYISLFEVWLIIVITHSIYSLNFSLTVFLVITSRNDQVLNFLEHVTYYVLTLYKILFCPHNKLNGEVFHYPQLADIRTLRLGIGNNHEVTGEARTEPMCPSSVELTCLGANGL